MYSSVLDCSSDTKKIIVVFICKEFGSPGLTLNKKVGNCLCMAGGLEHYACFISHCFSYTLTVAVGQFF